ncbi:hypothetical protein JTB14_011439 [Gonioctena quinquepunctata]|nr:hypothetical protein JTB14_011439 [Gonioctena quinquepunctata]
MLDSGSQSNFITNHLANKLKLKTFRIHIPVAGINNSISNISNKIKTFIYSVDGKYKSKETFLVIDKIAEYMPQISFDISTMNLPKNIILADSTFNESKPIDILLGARVFFDILCVGQIKTNASNPIIQKTKLGWVVSGHLNVENYDTRISCNIAISNNELYEQLQAFWKIEEVKTKTHYTLEELECEEHYAKTFRRDDQGRFEVTLPVKDELNQLGESEKAAITRFSSIEKRFIRDSEYKRAYVNFMNEYIQLKAAITRFSSLANPRMLPILNVIYRTTGC